MQEILNDKQLKFIDAYFTEQSIDKVCKKLDITRATYYNYFNDDAVRQEINRLRQEQLSKTTNYLQSSLDECSKILMDIIKSEKTTTQVKINAINSVFNHCNKLTEQVDILTKINDLEQRLSKQEIAED